MRRANFDENEVRFLLEAVINAVKNEVRQRTSMSVGQQNAPHKRLEI